MEKFGGDMGYRRKLGFASNCLARAKYYEAKAVAAGAGKKKMKMKKITIRTMKGTRKNMRTMRRSKRMKTT